MKLTIKTLQNTTFVVNIESDKTVKELKETVEKEQGKDYPSASQKLIYNGKILGDENKLTEYDFDEKKFLVLMVTRPPPPPKPAPAHEQSLTSRHRSDDKPKHPVATAASTATPAATVTRQHQASSSSSTSNPTATLPTTASSTPTQQQQPVSTNPSDATTMSDTQSRLSSLLSHQQFRQMQDLIQQSPHLLSSTIESLAVENPEMYNFISENPDVFVNALNYPPMPEGRLGQQVTGAGQRLPSQSRVGPGHSSSLPPIADQLLGNVSEHDKEAIERLKELGFSEYLAVQAYMACDKDEQLAANLLFQMDQ